MWKMRMQWQRFGQKLREYKLAITRFGLPWRTVVKIALLTRRRSPCR